MIPSQAPRGRKLHIFATAYEVGVSEKKGRKIKEKTSVKKRKRRGEKGKKKWASLVLGWRKAAVS